MSTLASFDELIRRVRAGDQAAATELVERYEPAIRRAVRFRLADSRLLRLIDSMDICQSVLGSFFLRTAAGQFDIERPEQLLKLLVTMARNKLALAARSEKRQRRDLRRVQSAGDEAGQFADVQSTPSQFVSDKELIREAQRLMSVDERQLVELRREGLEWADIADRLGSTPEALRKKLTRAIDRVMSELHLDEFHHE